MDLKHKESVKQLSRKARYWRKIHAYFGLTLAFLLAISSITGVLLSLKKKVSIIQPKEQISIKAPLQQWLPLDVLAALADSTIIKAKPDLVLKLDRIDVRPNKGLVKLLYQPDFWEVQIEGATGKVLSVEKRYSDIIEQIHDGTIVSDLFGLITMNVIGWGLLVLLATGLWLWYSPRLIRQIKRL